MQPNDLSDYEKSFVISVLNKYCCWLNLRGVKGLGTAEAIINKLGINENNFERVSER